MAAPPGPGTNAGGPGVGPRSTTGSAPFAPRVALASLSGESDAAWARAGLPHAGAAFLGGLALDGPTRSAARAMVADRDRTEFLPDDPLAFADRQLAVLADAPLRSGLNVRAVTPEPVERAARVCARRGAILELNAHCRQDELCAAGAGETLAADGDRLASMVDAAAAAYADALPAPAGADTDRESVRGSRPRVSVKLRAEVPGVALPSLAGRLAAAGADCLHVDAMDSEGVVAAVVDAVTRRGEWPSAADGYGRNRPVVIANNGVRDRATVREYLACGADAVSVGRPSDDERVLRRVAAAVTEWFDGLEAGAEAPRDGAPRTGDAAVRPGGRDDGDTGATDR